MAIFILAGCGGGVSAPVANTSDFPSLTKTVSDAPFALARPESSDPSPFIYTSDDRAVATIAGNMVTVVGAGTTKITATQLKDNFPIVIKSALLTVLPSSSAKILTLSVNSSTPLPAFGTRVISVLVSINGAAAPAPATQVDFTASCGSISSASVSSDATGTATVTYSANPPGNDGCAGRNVIITAVTPGSTPVTGTITVQPALAANLQFVNATPQLLYLAGSGAATLAQVTFRVVDTQGNALANQTVKMSLANAAPGVTIGALGNKLPVTLTTGSDGQVTLPVFSGSIPTSVQVNAALSTRPDINATSNALIIASGVPAQKSVSLALDKSSIEGLTNDGVSATISFSMADRQGNPVPVGTTVNFVSSHGVMIPATCIVPALPDGTSASSCTSSIRSQGTRPSNGKVVILAYAIGEEDFIDLNGNNVYDLGEPFTDLGAVFRDDDFSLTYSAGEFTVPRLPVPGASFVDCPATTNGVLGRAGTCDGVWGTVDVRAQRTVIFASGSARFVQISGSLSAGPSFVISDVLGNSLPTGTKIAVAGRAATNGRTCTATSSRGVVANTVGPTSVEVRTDQCVAGDSVDISITSPLGIVTNCTLALTE